MNLNEIKCFSVELVGSEGHVLWHTGEFTAPNGKTYKRRSIVARILDDDLARIVGALIEEVERLNKALDLAADQTSRQYVVRGSKEYIRDYWLHHSSNMTEAWHEQVR